MKAAEQQQAIGADLTPDAQQLARFVRGVYPHASVGGVVSLRAFEDNSSNKVFKIRPVRINATLDQVVEAAVNLAAQCAVAVQPIVFCPPLATFTTMDSASENDLREGLALSVELDARPVAARATLTRLIGPPTFTVESGGEWIDPETGKSQAKLHIHWRLREPTTTAADHQRLKRARALACDLVGADATAKAIVHPLRWPGSWHRKGTPRLARIVEETQNEVDLPAVLDELEKLAALRGSDPSTHDGAKDDRQPYGLHGAALQACAERIANTTATQWAEWNRMGLAFHAAANEAGFSAFDLWSQKHPKYNQATTRTRWDHFAKSPPSKIGAGTLIFEARRTDPGFIPPPLTSSDTAPDNRPGPQAPDLAEFLASTFPPRENIMDPVFPRQGLGMVHAWRGLGKTHFALWFAYACTIGGPFLKWRARYPQRVLYVDGEMRGVDMQERLIEIVRATDSQPDPGAFRIITPDLQNNGIPDLGAIEGQQWLEGVAADRDFLILDNLSSLLRLSSDKEDEPWLPMLGWLLDLRRRGKSVLLIHNDGKNETQRGASRREDQLDTVFHLKKPKDYHERDGARFVINFEKHRGFYGKDAEPFEVALTTNEQGLQEWTMTDLEDAVTIQVAELLNAGSTVSQISKELGIGRATVDRHKKKAVARGLYDDK